jgi:hypothetical protein
VGYDLHITRGRRWTDRSPSISDAEWKACVAADPDLELAGFAETPTADGVLRYESPGLAVWSGHPAEPRVWFDHRDGRVVVKNPDEATIAKMIAVARVLRARVQGDDGESYEEAGRPPRPATLSVGERLGVWLDRFKPRARIEPVPSPFQPGDRVRDFLGRPGTVTAVDPKANHGLGSIRVRFDDGRELGFAAAAHGLQRE